NSRYLFLQDGGVPGVRAFDLEKNLEVKLPENIGAEIYASELSVYDANGDVSLYHLGESLPFAVISLPLDDLPILRSACLAPDFDELAIAVDGVGGLFRIDTGKRVAGFPRFSAANLAEQSTGFLLMPARRTVPQQVVQLDTQVGTTSPAWTGGKSHLHSGGSVLLEYSFESPMGRGILPVTERGLPFMLRELEPASGNEFGKRASSFESAFSEGGMLFLQKDVVRVSVYSLQDSQLKSRLVGERLAASAASSLFAVSEGLGRLSIYDLQSLAKLDQQVFADDL